MDLVKRKAGTTHEAFKAYYESRHVKFGEERLPPYCLKYSRRYMTPVESPLKSDYASRPEFDCMVEFWFADEAHLEAFEASVLAAGPEAVRAVVEDEEAFIDRDASHRWAFEEHVSWEP
jgi:hypothetical protein